MRSIVLLGPPGAGKGTAAEALIQEGFLHVSTGDLLREQIRRETPLGIEAKKLMDQGQFVPDDVVVGMIRDRIDALEPDACILFDGFPRTLVQAEKLDDLMAEEQGTIEQVLLLECPDDEIVQRLSGRRSCSACGAVYHVDHNPPKRAGLCDRDGAELFQRSDDQEATVRRRLDVYEEQTRPLIDYYRNKNLIQPVNADQPIADVRRDVREALG